MGKGSFSDFSRSTVRRRRIRGTESWRHAKGTEKGWSGAGGLGASHYAAAGSPLDGRSRSVKGGAGTHGAGFGVILEFHGGGRQGGWAGGLNGLWGLGGGFTGVALVF